MVDRLGESGCQCGHKVGDFFNFDTKQATLFFKEQHSLVCISFFYVQFLLTWTKKCNIILDGIVFTTIRPGNES